jgi:hypothetical protein
MTTPSERVHREAARVSRRFLMRGFHVARAGNENKLTITHMHNSQFSLANRKQLADMLGSKDGGLRHQAKIRFNEKHRTLRLSFLEEYAEKKGALKLVGQIDTAEKRIEEWKAELSILGFRLDYDDELLLVGGSRNPLDKIIDDRLDKELGTSLDIDARFDSAQIAMMTVASLEDAEKLLKSVSEI